MIVTQKPLTNMFVKDFVSCVFCFLLFWWWWPNWTLKSRPTGFNFKTQTQKIQKWKSPNKNTLCCYSCYATRSPFGKPTPPFATAAALTTVTTVPKIPNPKSNKIKSIYSLQNQSESWTHYKIIQTWRLQTAFRYRIKSSRFEHSNPALVLNPQVVPVQNQDLVTCLVSSHLLNRFKDPSKFFGKLSWPRNLYKSVAPK